MNPPKAPAVQPPVPAPSPAAPVTAPRPRQTSAFWTTVTRMLTSTTCLVLGLGFIVLGIAVRKWPQIIPAILKPSLDQLFPHLPYFVVGVGLFFLGWARSMAAQDLILEHRKNRQHPHAWKIPLVSFQAFLLHMAWLFYAVPVGLGWYPPLQDLIGLVWVVFLMCLYVLWYLTAHSLNRFPAIAGVRMALVTIALSVVADLLWWSQQLFPAILLGMLGILSLLIALFIRVKGVEQAGEWPKITLLAVSVVFLTHVAYNALPFGKPTLDLVGLTLATKSLPGETGNLSYFTAADHSRDTIAFSQKDGSEWNLGVLSAMFDQESLLDQKKESVKAIPLFKISAGSEEFRPLFIKNGTWILADMAKGGGRGLWKVNAENGKAILLKRGIEPIEDGAPWSETRGQFLYVTQSEGKYRLNVLTLATGKSKMLVSSENPIHTPSWVRPANPEYNPKGIYPEDKVAFADGIHSLFYVVNVKTGEKELFVSAAERSLGSKFKPEGKVLEVVPAPDGFRYLYICENGKKKEIWLILADGTQRGFLYQTSSSIKDLTWAPDAQQILFAEIHHGFDLGFFTEVSTAKLLDANLGRCFNLIPPQISTWSPAIASDGVKVAFVAGEGLWYPSFGAKGIWVAALR